VLCVTNLTLPHNPNCIQDDKSFILVTKPIFNSQTIFLALTIINVLFFVVTKGNKKYFFGQWILFAIALLTFLIFRIFVFPQTIKSIETQRAESEKLNGGNISFKVWTSTRDKEKALYSYNRPTLEFCGFQIILTFISSLVGLKRTKKKRFFKRASFAFGFLTLIFICIYLLVSIIPYGMVT
jgi:hypothetical protein